MKLHHQAIVILQELQRAGGSMDVTRCTELAQSDHGHLAGVALGWFQYLLDQGFIWHGATGAYTLTASGVQYLQGVNN